MKKDEVKKEGTVPGSTKTAGTSGHGELKSDSLVTEKDEERKAEEKLRKAVKKQGRKTS
jgi:hypothetical protein